MKTTEIIINSRTGDKDIIEKTLTEQEIAYIEKNKKEIDKQNRIFKITTRLDELDKDFRQASLGAVFEDLEERKLEFQTLHNELRVLLGKEPREYVEQCKAEAKAEVLNGNN